MEVKKIVDQCYNEVKELLTEKKELIGNLAEELLAKESINLPEIMSVLGDRPFPLKESVKEYLEELEKRKKDEEETKFDDAADKATEGEEVVDAAEKADKDEEVVDSAEKPEESSEKPADKEEGGDKK